MSVNSDVQPTVLSVPLKESPAHQYSVREEYDLMITSKYLNHSGRTLKVGTRNGAIFDLQCRNHRYNRSFVIRQELYLSDNLKHSVRDRLLAHDGVQSEDFRQFKELFFSSYREQTHGLTMRYDYEVSPAMINENGGTIYIAELDIILSTSNDDIPLHPFCYEAMTRQPYRVTDSGSNCGISIELIDNLDTIGPRYTRLMGKVIRVIPTKDGLKRNGLYVKYRGTIENQRGELENHIDFVPEDQLDEVTWLHRSFAEARNAPDREVEVIHELKELELISKRLSAENSMNKAQQDVVDFQMDRELKHEERRTRIEEAELNTEITREKYHLDREQMRAKDHYEERSYARKDSSEWLKIFPTILLGAGAAFAALRGIFAKD